MRMPTLLSGARPRRNLFRIASGADPGSTRVVLLLLMLWASMGASGVTTAEPVGPSAAPAQSAGADDAGDDPEDTGLPLEVDRLVPLDMTEGSWISLDVSPDGDLVRKSTHGTTKRMRKPNVRSSLRIRCPNGPGS